MLGRQLPDPCERVAVGLGRRRCGHVVAELDLGAQAAGACPVDRAVDHDPVQPRAERAAAVEAVEVANSGEKRLLRDVLGGRRVAGDEPRGTQGARPMLAEQPFEVVDRALLGTPDPGALRHPTTLRRAFLMRSIRHVDLRGSMLRIPRMTRLLLVLAAAALLLPGAARAAACSPLNCAPSQFTLANGTLVAYRHTALGPVTVA